MKIKIAVSKFLIFLALSLTLSHSVLHAACVNLAQLAERLSRLEPGRSIRVSVKQTGNNPDIVVDGIIEGSFEIGGQAAVRVRSADGAVSTHFVNEFRPLTFQSNLETARAGSLFEIRTSSGSRVEGRYEYSSIENGQTHLYYTTPEGELRSIRHSQLDENSFRTLAQTPDVGLATGATPLTQLETAGLRLEMSGERSFVAFRNSAGELEHARIARLSRVGEEISIEVDVLDLASGRSVRRRLSPDELARLERSSDTEVFFTQLGTGRFGGLQAGPIVMRQMDEATLGLRASFASAANPLDDIPATRAWLTRVRQNNIADELTASRLSSIEGIGSPTGRRNILQPRLTQPPHNLTEAQARELTDLLTEAHLRQELLARGSWPAGRIADHVAGVAVKPNSTVMSGGGHTREGYERFLRETYNPNHTAEQIALIDLPAGTSPRAADFATGNVIIEELPNGVRRAYLPGDIMNSPSLRGIERSAANGQGFFRAATEGTEAYAGKSLFPDGWSQSTIEAAQRHIVANPQQVEFGISAGGRADLMQYTGTFTHNGQTVRLTVVANESAEGALQFGSIYPAWVQ